MYIDTNICFAPRNFIVHLFYGKKTCFCWNEDKLVIFPYTNESATFSTVLLAPAPIQAVQCFDGRIFIVCVPQGVYKLSRNREFALLSKSAIGIGSCFYEVLTQRNGFLCLDNKQNITSIALFQLCSKECNSSKLQVCPLNINELEEGFARAVTNDQTVANNFCVIGDGENLFAVTNEVARIIYNSIHSIRDLVPVLRKSKIAALLVVTDVNDVILMHFRQNRLVFDTIYLGVPITSICAGFSPSFDDILFILYSDESKFYCVKKKLLTDDIQRIMIPNKHYICLHAYDSKNVLGLTKNKELVQISIDSVDQSLQSENGAFISLHSDMLNDTSCLMDKIYKGTQELHFLNTILNTDEEKLRNINIYAHRYRAHFPFDLATNTIAGQSFLCSTLCNKLPKSSWFILNVRSRMWRTFCMKKISHSDTRIGVLIPTSFKANFSQARTDLIMLKDQGHPWCLIRNYTTARIPSKVKQKGRSEDTSFIHSKLSVLQGFINEGNFSMEKLLEIKKALRSRFASI